jgi:FlaA1/EpsC-like NDP-sugar epimerase
LNLFIGRLLLRYTDRFLSRWTVFGLDLLLVLATYLVAQFIAFNFEVASIPWASLPLGVSVLLPVYALGFLHSSSYVGVVRHSGGKDFTRLFQATVEATLFLLVLSFTTAIEYNRTALVSQAMLFLILSVGGRLAVRSMFLSVQLRKAKKGNGIIIVGAGSMGRAAQNAIEQDVNYKDYVIAYLDDNKSKAGKNINGIPILRDINALTSEYVDKNNVGKLVVAIKNISGIRLKELSNAALELGIEVSRVPPTSNWVNGELTAKQIRPISLEELLGRDPINLSYETLNGFIKGKTVLITGAAGSIGSELVRQVMRQNPKLLVCLDQAETPIYHLDQELSVYPNYDRARLVIGSVTDPERMGQIFRDFKPEVVFHAAAYKHVPLMEENPQEAVKTNILGTHLMARLASEHRAECFVMVSTDKAVNPTNIMGASKRAAEHVVNYFNDQPSNLTRFVTTRFGNVLGSNGSVIPLFKKQLQEGGPITLTHKDITRYFMTIPEAVRLVLEAGHMGKGGEILVFDMGEPVKIYDLAVNLIKLSGLTVDKDIKIIVTGLRPGEKLYEELLADGETTRPTHHQQIFISTSNNLDAQGVEALVDAAKGADKGWIQYISEYEQAPQ